MRKLKFNPMERAAGLFVVIAAIGTVAIALSVLIQKGYFETKVRYYTMMSGGAGVHVGTSIKISGMKAGSVETVEIAQGDQVKVGFLVLKSYAKGIKTDARIEFVRPSILAEKQFELSLGTDSANCLKNGAMIPSEESPDLLDVVSGRQITQIVANLDRMTEGLADLLGASGNQKNAQKIVANLGDVTSSMKKAMKDFSASTPNFAADLGQMLKSLSVVSREMAKIAPKLSESADGIPAGTQKLVELMNESTTLIKAMQKSFLLRGSVADVKEEEAKAKTAADAAKAAAAAKAAESAKIEPSPSPGNERAPASEK